MPPGPLLQVALLLCSPRQTKMLDLTAPKPNDLISRHLALISIKITQNFKKIPRRPAFSVS